MFLSSLSIAISVFYPIWIVSINRTGKELSKYLIPIGWIISLVWAGVWTAYRSVFGDSLQFQVPWTTLVPTALLMASLCKVWLVLKKQRSQQGELKRLRKVVVRGILLIPSLGLIFLSFLALQLYGAPKEMNSYEQNILAFLFIL